MTHPDLAGFPIAVALDVAWGDMDAYAHVNNVVYFRYFEAARIAYLGRCGWLASREEIGVGPIVASTQARYRKPLSYPDHLLVGARLLDVADDRFTLEHRVVSRAWGAVATDGQVVVVSFDYRANRKAPIPDAVRRAMAELEGRPG
ncbi:MAG: acyl-CoA thioesterase [Gemmataceae bacterium]|nr:acyl-CoA thioesterase [Gemmataceae bacterium]